MGVDPGQCRDLVPWCGLPAGVAPDCRHASHVAELRLTGTGIQTTAQAYQNRPTAWEHSGPGGVGAVLRAAAAIYTLYQSGDLESFRDEEEGRG